MTKQHEWEALRIRFESKDLAGNRDHYLRMS